MIRALLAVIAGVALLGQAPTQSAPSSPARAAAVVQEVIQASGLRPAAPTSVRIANDVTVPSADGGQLEVLGWRDTHTGAIRITRKGWAQNPWPTILHEALHGVAPAAPVSLEGRAVEEGFAQAVALDLLPALRRRVCGGCRWRVVETYPEQVAWARSLSRAACGCSSWRDGRSARERRRILALSHAERAALAARLGVAPVPTGGVA